VSLADQRVSAERVVDQVVRVLDDNSYRSAAQRLADELRAFEESDVAVQCVQGLLCDS